ncbi:hypothetical protein MMC28_010001 [Mycoblastus sanguinarius]|nr:hypothetical protein [Mycoblastus sanguinarius]
MPRRKAAKKPKMKPTSKKSTKDMDPSEMKASFSFPIDRLPSELLHMIYKYLTPREVAGLRLTCRSAARIGLEYLVPEICLTIKEDSFDRFLAISEHPIVSKYVKQLSWETDNLPFLTREEFEDSLETLDHLVDRHLTEPPSPTASVRAWRAYDRELYQHKKRSRHAYTEMQVSSAFSMYQSYCSDQDHIRQAECWSEKIAKGIKQMTNLDSLFSGMHGPSYRYTSEVREAYGLKYGYWHSHTEDNAENPLGLHLTRSILLAVEQADLKIESVCCGSVNWRTFTANYQDFAAMRKSIRYLKYLDMRIITGYIAENVALRNDSEGIRRIGQFVTSAPDLEIFSITFDDTYNDNHFDYAFERIIGNFRWPSLKSATFSVMNIREDDLMDFCARHTSTLEELSLGDIYMFEGTWLSTLRRMRQTSKLTKFDVHGVLGDDDILEWNLTSSYGPGQFIRNYVLDHNGEDIALEEYLKKIGISR